MSTYEPAHVEAVHGHAYAVRVPGQHTQPMPAVTPHGRPSVSRPADDEACRCPEHKYGRRPGTDAVLYSGPDAVMLLTHAAIRDGRYEDIGADFDEVQHSIHASFDASERRFARALAPVWRAVQRHDEATKQAAA
jgi:hypothetical protein